MNAREKILYLLGQIETANQLSAVNQPCFIDPNAIDKNKITRLELRTILEKLTSDGIIKLLEKPAGNIVKVGKPYYSHYKIEVLATFEAYYDKLYTSARFGIKNLTRDNYYRVYAVAEQINQELNIRTDNIATFEADKATPTLWKGVHEKSLSVYHTKQIHSKALGFLKEVGAIKTYELYKPLQGGSTQFFKVTVSRRKFDAAFLELILNSPERKSSALARKLTINKQSKSQAEQPDNTVPQIGQGKALIEPSNMKLSQDKVRFDAKASRLTFNSKLCGIPDETLEHYICKLVFKNRRTAAKEIDILDAAGLGQDSKRPVYDAMLRVNKKAREQLGIEKLLNYKAAKIRINTKYQ